MLNAKLAVMSAVLLLVACQCPKPKSDPTGCTQPTTQPVVRSVSFHGAIKLVNGDSNGVGPKVYYITFPTLPHRVSTDFGSLHITMKDQHIQTDYDIADEKGTNLKGTVPQAGGDITLNARAWTTIDHPVTHTNGTYQIMIAVSGAVAPYTTGTLSDAILTFTTDDPAKK